MPSTLLSLLLGVNFSCWIFCSRLSRTNFVSLLLIIIYWELRNRLELLEKSSDYKKTNFNEEPSNFWLRLIFAPFTLGLSFIGYNSEKQALLNKETNKDNKEWNANHRIKIDQENFLILKDITTFNENCNRIISFNWNLYHKTKNKENNYWYKKLIVNGKV